MIVSVLLLVLLGAIALLQSTQGLFSALIMAVMTVCCAAGALGTYEWTAIHWLAPHWQPNYAFAIALAATFGVPLIILRLLADKLIRRSCLLPVWIERLGGGSCGLVTAFTMVGVTAHALQLIPFNGSVLGYARIALVPKEITGDDPDPTPPDPAADEHELMLSPDRFAVGLVSVLSTGLFSGRTVLTDVCPDAVQAVGWRNAVPSEVSRIAPPGSISVVKTRTVPFVYRFTPEKRQGRGTTPPVYDEFRPKSNHEFQMVRVQLKQEARDENKSHRFTLRQFRLVGRQPGGSHFEQRFPIAIQQEDAAQPINRHIRVVETRWGDWPVVDDVFAPREGNNNQIEIVFELHEGFVPAFIEYKGAARAELTSFEAQEARGASRARDKAPAAAPATAPTVAASPPSDAQDSQSTRPSRRRSRRGKAADATVPNSGRGGRVRGITATQGASFFGDELPMPMTQYRRLKNVRIRRGALTDGHLVGNVADQTTGTDTPVARFAVPRDKRLLHLNTQRIQARSGLGRALSFATRVVQNYFVEDTNGNRYVIVGKYAIATVNGREVVEVEYFSNQAGSIGGVGPFDRIKDRHLKDNYELVLLFLVDPGADISAFSTGGAATRKDDLTGENLVAPS